MAMVERIGLGGEAWPFEESPPAAPAARQASEGGRVAVYYQNSFNGGAFPSGYYLQKQDLPDSIFTDDFESGDFSKWNHSGKLVPEQQVMTTEEKKMILRIYIHLLNEGTIVIRPTDGEQIKKDVFRVLPAPHWETEEWEFPPGSVVRCAKEVWDGEQCLVAKEVYEVAENTDD